METPKYAVGIRLRVISSHINAGCVGKVGTVVRIRPVYYEQEEGVSLPPVYEMAFDDVVIGKRCLTAFDERQLTQE